VKRLSVLAVLVVALSLQLSSGVAASGKPVFAPGGAQGLTAPAGAVCPFPLEITIVADRSTSKTFVDASGNPVRAIISGYILARFTNTSTADSITRNASGPALVVFHEGGSVTITGRGPGWLALLPTDEGGPSLTYFLGLTTFDISSTGQISNISTVGTQQNLCDLLA